jgi:hypothetical protein
MNILKRIFWQQDGSIERRIGNLIGKILFLVLSLPAIVLMFSDLGILVFVALLLLSVLAIISVMFLSIEAYARIRLLGYFAPSAASLVLGVDVVTIFAVIGIAIVLFPSDYWRDPGVPFSIISISILMFVAFGSAVLVRKLPKRSARVFGRRRVRLPLSSLGYLTIAGGVLAVLIEFYALGTPLSGKDFFLELAMGFMILVFFAWPGLSLILAGYSVRNQKTIEDALKSDARLPVLYLRPFMGEGAPFVLRPVGAGRSFHYEPITFEDHLGPTIRERIGPFVALGNPEDYLPHGGAVRTYADDKGWYEHFERLAGQADCIVMRVSDSNNLKQELTFIRREGLQRRLFIFTHLTKRRKPSLILVLWGRISLLLYGPANISGGLSTWEYFAENLGKLGFQLGNDPGRGAVVTFDSEGDAVVLVRGAEGFSNLETESDWPPSNFVEPIRQYLVRTLGLDLSKGAVKAESPQSAALPSENVVPTPG